jgi:hypothetical protein
MNAPLSLKGWLESNAWGQNTHARQFLGKQVVCMLGAGV